MIVMKSCIICSHAEKAAKTRDLIRQGLSDQKVADALNKKWPKHPLSFMAVHRHRRNHLQPELQNEIAMINKDAGARERRAAIAEAASAETPSTEALVEATLGLRRQVEKLSAIEGRLERMAALAEGAGASAGVAQLAAQQFPGIETGARLAGVGGFAPGTQTVGHPGAAPVFSITMVFPSVGRQETISVVENGRRADVEQELVEREVTDLVNGPADTDVP